MFEGWQGIRLADVVDVMVVAFLLWIGLGWLRRARTRLALTGLAILGGVYLAARWLELQLTVWILQGFFAVLVLVLVVVFQEDLRSFFEQIALWGLGRRREHPAQGVADSLVEALSRLAEKRWGGLLVLPGQEPLDRHLRGGIPLEGRLSEPLLLSIFDPHSAGHDGAVVLQGDRIIRFAVHLPLSADRRSLGHRGTRHAAALGLAERSDALAVVVSEETGEISVARRGMLRTLESPGELREALAELQAEISPDGEEEVRGWRWLASRWREGMVALGATALLWLVLVFGSTEGQVRLSARVRVENLPAGYELIEVTPSEVEVILRGRRLDLFLLDRDAVEVRLDATLAELGRRTFQVEADEIHPPSPGLVPFQVIPDQVQLTVRRQDEAGATGSR